MVRTSRPELLREWIRWHQFLGVTRFVIHDNGSNPPLSQELEGFEGLTLIRVAPVDQAQVLQLQNNCMKEALGVMKQDKIDWIALIDDDEFIFPRSHDGDLRTLLFDIQDAYPAYLMPWQMIGPCGQLTERRDRLTMETFLYGRLRRTVKTLTRVDALAQIHNHISEFHEDLGPPMTGAGEVADYERMVGADAISLKTTPRQGGWIELFHYRTRSLEFLQSKVDQVAVPQYYDWPRLVVEMTLYNQIERLSHETLSRENLLSRFLKSLDKNRERIYGRE